MADPATLRLVLQETLSHNTEARRHGEFYVHSGCVFPREHLFDSTVDVGVLLLPVSLPRPRCNVIAASTSAPVLVYAVW